MPPELYADYEKTGRREPFDVPFRDRLFRMNALALAECVEHKGRFIAPLKETINAILSEPTWVFTAHGKKIPVDLGAAQRAASLSTIVNWLGKDLGPELSNRIVLQIRERVINPFLDCAEGRQPMFWWALDTNNWNAVCHAGVVYSTLATVSDPNIRALVVATSEAFLANYLDGFTRDGYCSEGLGYWNYGFGHFILLAEEVFSATGGKIRLFDDPVITQVATYPARLEMVPGVFPVFADGSGNTVVPRWIQLMLGRRFDPGTGESRPFAAGEHPITQDIYLVDLTLNPPPVSGGRVALSEAESLRGWFPEGGVLVGRPENPKKGMAVASKGGHNAEHHNHNDVGSYVVVSSGLPVLVDPGAETYTKQTFGMDRYRSKVLSSYGHAVPMVDGKLQQPGKQHRGRIVSKEFSDKTDQIEWDIASAYAVPALESLHRTFLFDRTGDTSFEVTDEFRAASPIPFGTALMTFGNVERKGENLLEIRDGRGGVKVEIDSRGVPWTMTDEVLDENLTIKRKARRIGINLPAATEGVIRCKITPITDSDDKLALSLEEAGISEDTRAFLRIEAEQFSKEMGGAVEKVQRGGAEIIRLWDKKDHNLEWTFDIPEDGRFLLVLRYASGLSGGADRILEVDGAALPGAVGGFEFATTGGWGMDASEWRKVVLARRGKPFRISLEKGRHVFRLTNPNGAPLTLDWMELIRLDD